TTYYWRIDEVEADGATVNKGVVWSFTIPTRTAYDPDPSDRARFVDPDVTLSWEPGLNAITHDVYFGENSAEVNDGTGDTSKGTSTETTFAPGPLEKDTTYYWRIDEFDGSETNKGDLWRFRTLPEIAISEPNLIGSWKLDDGSGTTALDSSGHGNHGTLGNNPQWVFGYDGGAIEFDGMNYIDLPTGLIGTDKGSVCMWIKTTQDTQGHIFYGSEEVDGDGFGGQNEFHINMRSGGRAEFFLEGGDAGDVRVRTSAVNDDTWHHIAATWDAAEDMIVYVDGINPESSSHNGNIFNLIGRIRLGSPSDYERYYFGSLDDVRLYDYVLTQEEIAETMKGDTRFASDPSPAHESIADKERAAPLSWSPGENAAQHDIYFGTDLDAVVDVDASDTSGVYRGRQNLGEESYTPTEVLEFNQTYYWRIDQYNNDATIGKGNIWTFTVADYLIIDDFEDYTNYQPDDIFSTWSDGYTIDENGALVGYDEPDFVETEIVNSGNQSMPYIYYNSGPANYSEASRAISNSKDWTREGVTELSLWFIG
ncbi:MAG: LamG domain-containing protein, partial [candidate division Zixibacteria bacterium]|nr:LamG domain-containing protein [candidate division Zixibacteria bacterium]